MGTRLVILGFLLATSAATPAGAQSSLECDASGACYGALNGQTFSGFKDGFGNISGQVGNQNFIGHLDAFGNLSGRIGERNVDGHVDAFGNASVRYLDGGGPESAPRASAHRTPPTKSPPRSASPSRPVWDAPPAPGPRSPVCFTTRHGRTICSKVQ